VRSPKACTPVQAGCRLGNASRGCTSVEEVRCPGTSVPRLAADSASRSLRSEGVARREHAPAPIDPAHLAEVEAQRTRSRASRPRVHRKPVGVAAACDRDWQRHAEKQIRHNARCRSRAPTWQTRSSHARRRVSFAAGVDARADAADASAAGRRERRWPTRATRAPPARRTRPRRCWEREKLLV